MRRKELQVTAGDEIAAIIAGCEVCRLGMVENGKPYIVPMNFAYEFTGQTFILYFHCAREGRKLDILGANPFVCFEMDRGRLVLKERACNATYQYESVIGNGRAELIDGHEEKVRALERIAERYAGPGDYGLTPEAIKAVRVIKVTADDYCAKRNES